MRNYSSKLKSNNKLSLLNVNVGHSHMDTNFYSTTSDTRKNNPSFASDTFKKSSSKGRRKIESENTMRSKDLSCGSGRKMNNSTNYKKGSTYEMFLGYNHTNVGVSNVFKSPSHHKEQSVNIIIPNKLLQYLFYDKKA